jgi:hypothetical protein
VRPNVTFLGLILGRPSGGRAPRIVFSSKTNPVRIRGSRLWQRTSIHRSTPGDSVVPVARCRARGGDPWSRPGIASCEWPVSGPSASGVVGVCLIGVWVGRCCPSFCPSIQSNRMDTHVRLGTAIDSDQHKRNSSGLAGRAWALSRCRHGFASRWDCKEIPAQTLNLRPELEGLLRRRPVAGSRLSEQCVATSARRPRCWLPWWPRMTVACSRRSGRERAGLCREWLDLATPYCRRKMGHRNPSTTLKIYSHFVPETDQEAAQTLGRIFEDAAHPIDCWANHVTGSGGPSGLFPRSTASLSVLLSWAFNPGSSGLSARIHHCFKLPSP